MSLYLYKRLQAAGNLRYDILLEALGHSLRNQISFVESLVILDMSHARALVDCFGKDGERADPSWRPDPRLLFDLPPGICERLLAFPFRDRAGAVEVATVSPFDTHVRAELRTHFKRPVTLFRANLQGLLAAAGAPIDVGALTYRLSAPPLGNEDNALPLVRKSAKKAKPKARTATSPGLGILERAVSLPPSLPFTVSTARPPTWIAPTAQADAHLSLAKSPAELSSQLCALLPAPTLVFKLNDGALQLVEASGPGVYGLQIASLAEESGMSTAARDGNYFGPWYDCSVHRQFSTSFSRGSLVRVDRIGEGSAFLIVVTVGEFDIIRAASLLKLARQAWTRITELYESR